MKERKNLSRAMTELPDDLLLEAEAVARPRKVIKFRRLVAAAAVIAMLAVTVGAVPAGINEIAESLPARISELVEKVSYQYLIQRFGKIWEEYYTDPTLGFEKLEFTVPLEVVELPEENMEILQRLTEQAGRQTPGEAVDFYVRHRNGHYSIPDTPFDSFASLKDVENLLGIPLELPEAVRENLETVSEFGWPYVWVRVYARSTGTDGALEPAKLELSFGLEEVATNGNATGTIVIALTEETARDGMLIEAYSYEKEGSIWQEAQIVGTRDVTLFGNDPEEGYDGWAEAIYIQDGIGYCISARRDGDIPHYSPNWPYYDSAKEIVLSLFADGE